MGAVALLALAANGTCLALLSREARGRCSRATVWTLCECVSDATRNGFRGDADSSAGFRVGDRRDAGMLVTQPEQG